MSWFWWYDHEFKFDALLGKISSTKFPSVMVNWIKLSTVTVSPSFIDFISFFEFDVSVSLVDSVSFDVLASVLVIVVVSLFVRFDIKR